MYTVVILLGVVVAGLLTWKGVAHFGFIAALLPWFAWCGCRQWRAEKA